LLLSTAYFPSSLTLVLDFFPQEHSVDPAYRTSRSLELNHAIQRKIINKLKNE
jgi:hypothetical protein